ncbi:tetratricopeptide repeat protein [Sphingomonas sp. Leaf412]|uniref:tetratricopeptide repeat protein n=1 Tax=Sphingomonas sp. Leaf412 TaxID=1736370 RepID=UPI00138EFAA4|nr:tetratricopeptide repeat protein [Sphingomonas sp. Leaf412]
MMVFASSSTRVRLTIAALLGVVALIVLLVTPAGLAFVRSARAWAVPIAGLGVFALSTVLRGLRSGRVTLLDRGLGNKYDREVQPIRFWAAMCWNTVMGTMLSLTAVAVAMASGTDDCVSPDYDTAPRDRFALCDRAIAERPPGKPAAALYAARGTALHEMGEDDRAIADYDRAVDLNPSDSYSLYNRALLYHKGEQFHFAIEDYTRSLKLRGDNIDAYINRGDAHFQRHEVDDALRDFSHADRLDSAKPEALARRGLAYAAIGDRRHAEDDFRVVRMRDAANATMFRGEALLCLQSGDHNGALFYLNALLDRKPGDTWAIAALADTYARLGQAEKAQQVMTQFGQTTRKR